MALGSENNFSVEEGDLPALLECCDVSATSKIPYVQHAKHSLGSRNDDEEEKGVLRTWIRDCSGLSASGWLRVALTPWKKGKQKASSYHAVYGATQTSLSSQREDVRLLRLQCLLEATQDRGVDRMWKESTCPLLADTVRLTGIFQCSGDAVKTHQGPLQRVSSPTALRVRVDTGCEPARLSDLSAGPSSVRHCWGQSLNSFCNRGPGRSCRAAAGGVPRGCSSVIHGSTF